MNKKNFKKSGVMLLVSALAVGGAYAVLTASDVDTNTQTITTGTFEVKFTAEGNGFSNMNAQPMNRADGIVAAPAYEFTVTNNGTIDAVAKLGAVNVAALPDPDNSLGYSDNMLNPAQIHVIIQDVTANPSAGIAADGDASIIYEGLLSDLMSEDGSGKFGAGSALHFAAGEAKQFKMVAYLDEHAANGDVVDGTGVRTIDFTLKAFYAQEDGGIFTYDGTNINAGATSWDALFNA